VQGIVQDQEERIIELQAFINSHYSESIGDTGA
jgi:hypothetical protein